MKLLLIGGTMFVGKHCVEVALRNGHEVTLFNRGKHGAELFPGVERIVGDRGTDLDLLKGRKWDAVIDTCGYVPRIVKASAEALKDAVDHYTFVSTISVYSDMATPNQDESGPLGTLEDETVEQVTGETYGPLKVLCEKAVEEALPGRTLITRPTLIVGPDDPTDRFTYWPVRFATGGRVLLPDRREQPAQIIDVRDLAEWTVALVEKRVTGIYNGAGPGKQLTMGAIYDGCLKVINPKAVPVYASEEFLLENEVSEWGEFPLWLSAKSNSDGMESVNIQRSIDSGLKFRSLDQTLIDTLEYHRSRGTAYEFRAGLKPDREAELLAKWDSLKE
jgi:2'-hydroxyisoflavone reductase